MKQDTRAALLLAGRRLFARNGFDGTSVRAITTAAHANLGAITYHFGSKQKFYEAVLASCAEPLADAAVAAAQGSGSARQRVGAVVRAYFEYLGADANIARLLMHELVLGRTPPESTVVPIRRIHSALTELVADGQRRGEFRDGDAPLLAISIISQPVHMNLVRRVLKAFGVDLERAETRAHVIEHAIAFACAGLAHEGRGT
jgi:AcrR family transcriptional regulator